MPLYFIKDPGKTSYLFAILSKERPSLVIPA